MKLSQSQYTYIHTVFIKRKAILKGIDNIICSLLKMKWKPPKVFENDAIPFEDNLVFYKIY